MDNKVNDKKEDKAIKDGFFKRKKKKIIIGSICILSMVVIIISGMNKRGVFLSEAEKIENINSMVTIKNYTRATELNNMYFDNNNRSDRNIYDKQKKRIDSYIDSVNKKAEEDRAKAKAEAEIQANPISIIKQEMVSISENYNEVQVTVKNNGSKNITYVKIGIDFMNESKDIVQSDWTNDSSVIKPGATQTITKMIARNGEYKYFNTEVLSFN